MQHPQQQQQQQQHEGHEDGAPGWALSVGLRQLDWCGRMLQLPWSPPAVSKGPPFLGSPIEGPRWDSSSYESPWGPPLLLLLLLLLLLGSQQRALGNSRCTNRPLSCSRV